MANGSAPTTTSDSSRGYTVLARRYRSRTFDEVIGQEPIARTLANAITANRTAHAYLFCGTRGVGKTSMARIFAKELNVTDDLAEADAVADAIFRGDDLDVVEIDGASNRGINEAKDLIAGAGLSPARCPYKIYIIDEVHMLTKEAFNALLKTMEEPPSHVKFILCTTDPHKVPATIQSRCQRFDFRAIATARIVEHLQVVLEQEQVTAEGGVLEQVARFGNGSMRDALSLLDRLLASGDDTLTSELLEQMLGLPDSGRVQALVDAIAAAEVSQALQHGHELIAGGASIEQALQMLAEQFRMMMIVGACGEDAPMLELSDDARARAVSLADQFDTAALVHMIALCDAAIRNAKGSVTARALFDACIVRLCLAEQFADIRSLLQVDAPADASASRKKKDEALTHSPPLAPPAAERTLIEPKPATQPVPDVSHVPDVPAARVADDQLWEAVTRYAGLQNNHMSRALVESVTAASFDGRTLRLTPAAGEQGIARQKARFEGLIERATNRRINVEFDTLPDATPAVVSSSPDADYHDVHQLPAVQRAIELFDAVIVGVDQLPTPTPTAPAENVTPSPEDLPEES